MARVLLHIGGPKTGTSFLQAVLWQQRDLALEQGLLLPLTGVADHYRAYLELSGQANWMGVTGSVDGAWARLLDAIADHPTDSLVSTEFLVHATAEHADRAVRELSALGREVHVVITVRDLARFLPSQWQETIKSTRTWTFDDFLDQTREGTTSAGAFQRRLWNCPDWAATWAQVVGPDRVHVVTVPPAGAPRSLLWERFASVLGLDAGRFSLDLPRANDSLGAEQAELLRRINVALAGRLAWPAPYKAIVKRGLARRILAQQPGTAITVPAAQLPWVRAEADAMVGALAAGGVDVVGDLSDLRVPDVGQTDRPATADPGASGDTRIADEAVAAMAELLLATAEARERNEVKVARLRSRLAASDGPTTDAGRRRGLGRWLRAKDGER
ncbi:hypothetical protein SAMN04487968_106171 [Nocardioides terrae]|uniref:Sulfotransferase family protein n=1 Tax=Nocardioides terrae TaxID=574651 RepID=A0A1I1J3S9_9ACTN|nr:hypothetical protein [Nocardioides terrae]SFC43045.1 hypothetical protein SAMN04487968_106171 [Nocardioides terrae]